MSAFRGAFPAMTTKRTGVKSVATQQMIHKALMKFEAKTRELKLFNANTAAGFGVAGAVAGITQNITQGDTAVTRDGNSINVKQLDYNYLYSNAGAGNDFTRLIVFVDTQSQGALPLVGDILTTATVSSPYAFGVIITKRFRILKDIISPAAALTGGPNPHVFRGSIQLNNHHVQYLSSTATAADNGAGQIYFLVINDNIATANTTYDVNFLVRYYDA